MKTIRTTDELEHWLRDNPRPAFVPTMGALHRGHLSLVEFAGKSKNPVLVSIFVNPTQFGPDEDFEAYPRDIAGDLAQLESAGVDAVFLPTREDIYPAGTVPVLPELPQIFSELEGAERPNHFLGVAQVLAILFQLIRPPEAFFGQKDYQQTILVKWLVSILPFSIEIQVCPIVREESGLAMSSRNQYLTEKKRRTASIIFRSLLEAKALFGAKESDPRILERKIRTVLQSGNVFDQIDYVEIRDAESLEKIDIIERLAVILLVVRVGKTRLLDNMLLRREYIEV